MSPSGTIGISSAMNGGMADLTVCSHVQLPVRSGSACCPIRDVADAVPVGAVGGRPDSHPTRVPTSESERHVRTWARDMCALLLRLARARASDTFAAWEAPEPDLYGVQPE